MSDFRKFCIGGFVTAGLMAFVSNHFGDLAPGTAWEKVTASILLGGVATVMVFGARKDDRP